MPNYPASSLLGVYSMSAFSGLDVAQIVATQQSIVKDYYCTLAALTLLVFENAITLDREVALFWKRKVTGASALFLSSRYITLLAYSVRTMLMANWSCSPFSYSNLTVVAQILAYTQYIPWAFFSALRVFALCDGRVRWPTAILVFVLSSPLFAMNYARLHWLTRVEDTVAGTECLMAEVRLPEEVNKFRGCIITADAIVLCVTWHTTYWSTRMGRKVLVHLTGRKRSFSSVLLHDGTRGLLLTMNIIYLTLTMFPTEVDSLTQVSYVVEFSEPLTAILVSRFLLNLQAVGRRTEVSSQLTAESSPTPSARPGTLIFANQVVGSLGSFLSSPTDENYTFLAEVRDSSVTTHKSPSGNWELQGYDESPVKQSIYHA
ncbi:hypothetical protein DICSQDRAFT_153973 [Dichomitus squalens LYAD-421 SS1]|uniref:uncharacterized protein n=1 Tax=Dichomitus squalens (strain LYAD-421) TaxID=732165 RepID=UPI000441133A|nr:uncharacterized protein DICSQDRAFT_153973 [Dichomitus squalens LYAD-421 SS1]EJF63463.1 hypothetical protein DICSQDRAFT_153973 [Dichomitus squalens LYAD-421 SS1]